MIHDIINLRQKKAYIQIVLHDDGLLISDESTIANRFINLDWENLRGQYLSFLSSF